MSGRVASLITGFLHIKDMYHRKQSEFEDCIDQESCETVFVMNVVEQVQRLPHEYCPDAWQRASGWRHGWIYGINDGLLKDLNVTFDGLGCLTFIDNKRKWAFPPRGVTIAASKRTNLKTGLPFRHGGAPFSSSKC